MAGAGGAFIWYELNTPDPGAAKRFYDSVVGWNIAERPVAQGIDYYMIGRSDGGRAGGVALLGEDRRSKGARPAWLAYVQTADVDRTVAAMEADGARVVTAPWDQPGVGRLALLADPGGAHFYLMDPLPPEGQPDAVSDVFSTDRPQHVRWNELATSDPAGAVDFYTRHFGWVQNGDMDMGPVGKYQFVYHGGTMIGAVMPLMPGMPVSRWTFYIGVDDIDRAASAVTAGGGEVVDGPMEIPGGDYALKGVDPQGARFALVGPRTRQGSEQ
jgi:hypothetical protein